MTLSRLCHFLTSWASGPRGVSKCVKQFETKYYPVVSVVLLPQGYITVVVLCSVLAPVDSTSQLDSTGNMVGVIKCVPELAQSCSCLAHRLLRAPLLVGLCSPWPVVSHTRFLWLVAGGGIVIQFLYFVDSPPARL